MQTILGANGVIGNNLAKYSVLKKWMLQMVGLFTPVVRESIEMLYQNEGDYLFDSSKFSQAFEMKTLDYKEGIKATVQSVQI